MPIILLSATLGKLATTLGVLSVALAAIPQTTILPTQIDAGASFEEIVGSLPENPTQGAVRSFIAKSAGFYGVSGHLAIFIAEKESRFNPLAVNPKTGAGGLFQWLKSSWISFCEGNRFDIEDNTRCAMKTLSEPDGIRHWSADLSMRQQLINEGLIECFEGKNNCYLL